MDIKDNLKERELIASKLADQYITQTSPNVIFIQAGYGQGKSYIIECLLNALKNYKDIETYRNIDNEFISGSQNIISNINSLNVSGGAYGFSFGLGVGWNNNNSDYAKIRNILSKKFKNNILICLENISDVSDEIRFFTTSIIKNILKLQNEFKKKIFLLITDSQESYQDIIYAYTNSYRKIKLPAYTKEDIKNFLSMKKSVLDISEERLEYIWTLSQGNLDLVDFLFEEVLINEQEYISTLRDVVVKRIALIKNQGEKCELGGKKMEEIVFSASLALKKFSASFITNIVNEKISDVETGLNIIRQEAILKKDIKNYYDFISIDIQNYITEITLEKHESLLISYYNFYTKNEQDEYYFRAYYIYKYWNQMCPHAFSLFILAYSSAKQTSDNIKIDKIENIMKQKQVNEKYKEMFEIICEYYNILFEQSSIEEVEQAYKNITRKYSWELPVKAEITYEYFYYIYKNTDLDKVTYHNTLNDCINYALNELIIDTQDTTIIKPIDETILRLKIIYGISPCVLDIFNDYDTFNLLYHKSQELSSNSNTKHGIGEYIENVFNRKAFLFANQAACSIYYEKAKKYFERNEIWDEYYITLVCQAGTDIVIQEFDEAIELCNQAEEESNEKNIKIPQIEKLYNNRIIAEFLLKEQTVKTPQKAIIFAKTAIRELKKLITKEKNATQFVIYTNICSLYLYIGNDKQYIIFKNKLEKLYGCDDISDITDQNIDDFYRYYFAWFELYRIINCKNWEKALQQISQLDNFIPALFRKQEIFWQEKNNAVRAIIESHENINPYDFCHNLVKTKRNAQSLSKFFFRGLMLSDLQYTSYV